MGPPYSTTPSDRDPLAIRLDDDTPVLVGAVEAESRARAQRCDGRGSRMTVVVPSTARDHGDIRPQLSQLALEPGVGGAVVRDLEDLDVAREEWCSDIGLGVSGQERVDLSVGCKD